MSFLPVDTKGVGDEECERSACHALDHEIASNGRPLPALDARLAARLSIRKSIEWDWPDATRARGCNPATP
jgi:hypothetical protein